MHSPLSYTLLGRISCFVREIIVNGERFHCSSICSICFTCKLLNVNEEVKIQGKHNIISTYIFKFGGDLDWRRNGVEAIWSGGETGWKWHEIDEEDVSEGGNEAAHSHCHNTTLWSSKQFYLKCYVLQLVCICVSLRCICRNWDENSKLIGMRSRFVKEGDI